MKMGTLPDLVKTLLVVALLWFFVFLLRALGLGGRGKRS
jgi:hypothetical protein